MSRSFNLADLLEQVAESVPDRIAVVCGAQRVSFRQLDERATRLASALRGRGVRRGDNIGLQLYNSVEYFEAFFACCKLGAAPVNINYRYRADELAYVFESLALRGLFFDAEFSDEVSKAAARARRLDLLVSVGPLAPAAPAGSLIYEELVAAGSPELADPERSDADLMLLCTGGTTGMPKGVMWPHKSLFMGALGGGGTYFGRGPIERPDDLAELLRHGPVMSYFAAAPLMHAAAMWASLISLYAGHTVVLSPFRSFEAEKILDLLVRERVNIISVVGDAMGLPLVQALEAHPGRWDLSAVRVFGNGGAVLTRALQDRIKAALPHVMVNNGMGSSEGGVIGGGERPKDGDGFMRIAPRPDLGVIDDRMRRVSAPGAQGTLARTGYTPIGYFGDAKKTAETFVNIDGRIWVLMGDRVRIDAEGHYVLLGRGSQCINSGGEKIFPEEVEEAARRYRAVRDVLVVGLPDERWGAKVVAVIEPEPGVEFQPAEFERVCRENLASFKVPRAVFLTERVLRSPAGKANYTWAKNYAEEQDRQTSRQAG